MKLKKLLLGLFAALSIAIALAGSTVLAENELQDYSYEELEHQKGETAKAWQAIDTANGIAASNYTSASMAAVMQAKRNLEAVLNNKASTSTDIKDATDALNVAIAKLRPKVINPLKVTAKSKNYKRKQVNKKKQAYKALTVSGAQGAVSYTVKPVNKKSKKALSFNKNTGKITVKKKTKKGTYKMKITVSAAGNDNYFASGAITKTITVKVK